MEYVVAEEFEYVSVSHLTPHWIQVEFRPFQDDVQFRQQTEQPSVFDLKRLDQSCALKHEAESLLRQHVE